MGALEQQFREMGLHVDSVEIETFLSDSGFGTEADKGGQGSHNGTRGDPGGTNVSVFGKSDEPAADEIDDGHIHVFV